MPQEQHKSQLKLLGQHKEDQLPDQHKKDQLHGHYKQDLLDFQVPNIVVKK